MPVEFQMPKLGLTMEEGTIREWLVSDGTTVTAGTPVLVIETDKTETEVEVNGTGVLHHAAGVGDTLRCGEVIGYLLTEGEAPPATTLPGGRIVASPNARRVAAEVGVDLADVRGTGPGGRITSEDVADATAHRPRLAAPSSPLVSTQAAAVSTRVDIPSTTTAVASVAARQLADLLGVDLAAVAVDPTEGRITRDGVAAHVRAQLTRMGRPTESALLQVPSARIPMTGMRGTIATRMHASLHEMAQLTLNMDATMTAVIRDRERRKDRRGSRKHHSDESMGVPGYTDYIVAASARALRRHPLVNAQVIGNEIALLPDIHVGLAVAVDGGLVVPVVRHADRLTLAELAAETSRLAGAARSRTLPLADLEGGTFSVTALGMFGVDAFTPVVNPPNAAILGVGRIRDDVTVRKGKVTTVPRLTLSLTWDHRVLDGAPAAAFARSLVELLAEPGELDEPADR